MAALHAAGVPLSQVAVLVRTNAQTLPVEQAFAGLGLPCQVRGAERFFDRPEVRQAVGLLRAAASPRSAGPVPDGRCRRAGAGWAGAGGSAAEVRHILAGLGLTQEPPAGRGAARERWESLAALAQLAEDYFAALPAGGLRGFAAELATGRRSSTPRPCTG